MDELLTDVVGKELPHDDEIMINICFGRVEMRLREKLDRLLTGVDMSFKRCCFGFWKSDQQALAELSSEKNVKLFSYSVLRSATDNFHRRNKLGRGGFGTVYKGILTDGTPIAAKVLSAESKQGIKEFLNEIDVITNVKHPNLVLLIGCCIQGANRILVYEYVENNSLYQALIGTNSERAILHWGIRSEICIGTAKGLAYLHEGIEPHIVHRDIKASNILLTEDFVPKIGDFGLAKLFPDNVTHISTRVAGTMGYLAPEYAMQGQLTRKADIYSFGVLVLEIISGKSSSKLSLSNDGKVLLERSWELYEEGKLTELVDPCLEDYPEDEVIRYIKVALFCTQSIAGRRPSMPEVLHMLSKPIRLNESELIPPGIIPDSTKLSEGLKGSKTFLATNAIPIPELSSTPDSFTELVPR